MDYAALAALTEGYLPADLRDLVNRSIQQAAIRANKTNAPKDVRTAVAMLYLPQILG